MTGSRRTITAGLLYDPRCLAHDNGSMVVDEQAAAWLDVNHAENADRVRRAHEVLVASGAAGHLVTIEPRLATEGELALVHTAGHIERIRATADTETLQWVGPDARANGATWGAARASAGAAIACTDHAIREATAAYSLTRPPGHHASADRAMGFCLFNNAAVAARHAQRVHGIERIAIVDWDVHHGNGTQEIFYEDAGVLFVSIHQDGLYPKDLGTIAERGAGEGRGFNLNVPMPASSGDAGYLAAVDEVVVPAMEAFGPELVILSSGQDAAASDPLGRMSVTTEGFRQMTGRLVEFAEAACGGRIAALQEGGYSLDHMPFCTLATIEALAGLEPSLEGDPIELDVTTAISVAETDAIKRAREVAANS